MKSISAEELKECMARVAQTDDGRVVLAAIMGECRWNSNYVDSSNMEGTFYHAAVRGVWASTRSSIPVKDLKEIEYNYIFPKQQTKAVEDGRSISKHRKRISTSGGDDE